MSDSTPARPGLGALVAMQKQQLAVAERPRNTAVFKVPAIPHHNGAPKPDKMKILNEEQYVEELGKIIEKDFFPDLEKLRAQNQYLDAAERNDLIKMRELHAKYSGTRPSQRSTGCESPATFETPVHNPNATPTPTPRSRRSRKSSATPSIVASEQPPEAPSTGHTLDSFLTCYTSEDNNSFQDIIEASDRKLHQKFAVLYNAENDQAKQMALALALPDIHKQFEAIEGPKRVETWTYRNKNYIMYVPEGVELTRDEQLDMAKRKMEIVHENTRLHGHTFDERQNKAAISALAKSHTKGMCGRIGVDGNYLDGGGQAGQVRGFGFVQTPSPAPGVDASPLMTWGEIEGTPFRLDGSDTPVRPMAGASFRINETSRRETIALELADRASERKRGQKAKAIEAARRNIGSPAVRSTLERLASMSPAAKRLATGGRSGSGSGLRRPTTGSTHSGFCTPSPLLVRRKTPAMAARSSFGVSSAAAESFATGSSVDSGKSLMTDDLLNIPIAPSSRKNASDFF